MPGLATCDVVVGIDAGGSSTSALARASSHRVAVTRSPGDPIAGAVRLAGSIRR